MKVQRPNSTLKQDTEKPLRRTSELKRSGPPSGNRTRPKRQAISPASPAQREKVRISGCIVTMADATERTIHPAHLAARAHGGCDHDLCVVGLVPEIHRLFDDGQFDLLPYLVRTHVEELQHALGHYDGDLISLLQRLTGERWAPVGGSE